MPEETVEEQKVQENQEVQETPEAPEAQEVQETPEAQEIQEAPEVAAEESKKAGQIFVVCGKNEEMNQAAKDVLAKFNLEAILLGAHQEETGSILETSSLAASFAIVVLSDDDVATPQEEFPRNALLQPRSEEIFLLGFLAAKLGTKNIFLLTQPKQNFKQPFQHISLLYTSYDKENRWQFDLVRVLKSAGFDVDANKLI